ncbi:unnamed protein product [Lactuca virosa]|uniref:Uncharacterized protein n=1 Tax=Lactuca virosa TaxID=75947 RepID=A0AAU9NR04_9ASTR|nr:unnamed protein product [Lactuca virosa]
MEVSKEVIPSKTCILQRTKKRAKRPQHSPLRPCVPDVEVQTPTKSHHTHSSSKGVKKIRKPQLNRRGVLIREVHAPVSLASMKRQAKEMVKKA